MKKFYNSRLWLGLVSVFFAILLFLSAVSNSNNASSQKNNPVETFTQSITDVPIDMKYNSDKYFISDYSYGSQVYLSSTNRVKLDSEVNGDTRHFKIVADLTNSKPGKVSVPLKVSNLPIGLTAKVTPDRLTVTIGRKKTKSFPVTGGVDPKQIVSGYEIASITSTDKRVEVTSDESKIDLIDHVVAKLPDNVKLSSDYNDTVTLQAVSADGTILASSINPAKTDLEVKIKKISKTVPVSVLMTGQMSDRVSEIQPRLSRQTVVISGPRDVLDTINEVTAKVDITDVTKSTSKTVTLSEESVTIEPSSLNVQLTVKKK
ncbi:YbbR-like domain-containing protein YbbR [Streptococcus parauberis]|uniref:Secreted protein n=1 Tax=Streptococcus parauberis KRS-02083 TaxID=1207545 RepID=A0ABN0IS33_9STRE|nr:CdaR family protein [Streptococcus parauberis]AUT06337.1 YbbR-like domain-containing protein YbbR [Streptococcus parauberis]EMG25654.1 putative secreted protein [Streptococcus parauberis KRS-02083]UWV09724.1 CdaR family protein [Streptococcus parauberis]WEM61945.1 CdaR family protein [Streptococcus parauberis]WEM64422.1 CdaR family protein [Streptococcus parauberis]